MNPITLCEKRKSILAQNGHILVLGGPGSGKTTIALLKAKERCRSLQPGQAIIFLSFSRAAVQQILVRSAMLLSHKEQSLVQVQTYHSFFIELLQAHGHLLHGRQAGFIYPGQERLRKSAFGQEWDRERRRLADELSVFCFDLVARGAGVLLKRSEAVRKLYAAKFPLIIVDEFQDTDDEQWNVVFELAAHTEVMCLADSEQRIFDYRPEVDPERISKAQKALAPTTFDFGGENRRSPDSGILSFADCVLTGSGPLPTTPDVRIVSYFGNDFEARVHLAVLSSFGEARKRDIERPTLAVLCRTNGLVAHISEIISQARPLKQQTLPAIDHSVLWDAELSAAAAIVVGGLMDDSGQPPARVARCLHLVAQYYHVKNAESPSASASKTATSFEHASTRAAQGESPRLDAAKQLTKVIENGLSFVGDPMKDWLLARQTLKGSKSLEPLYTDASLVRLFGARRALATGLEGRWLATGRYGGAAEMIRQILDREHVVSSERTASGCAVMNIHKAKGKEFDAVVIVEGLYSGVFFGTADDRKPRSGNRRLLRVAITRARSFVSIVRPRRANAFVE